MSITPILLRDIEHGGASGQPAAIAMKLAEFIAGAQVKLHLAIYDFRLSDHLGGDVVRALRDRAAAGVDVKIPRQSARSNFFRPHLPSPTSC